MARSSISGGGGGGPVLKHLCALSVDLVIQTLANDSIPTTFWLYNEMKFIIMLDCTCCKKIEQTRNKYTVPVKYFVWEMQFA